MARFTVSVRKALLIRADIPQVALAADSLFGRLRDLGFHEPMLFVALARIVAQLMYRISSERWRETESLVVFQVELADWEREALRKHIDIVLAEIDRKIEEYRALLYENKARNPSTIESRIDALMVLRDILNQIANGKKQFKPLLREQ